MIAVIYARYSSELQRSASIEDQVRLCRARIDREGWSYLHAYTDRAVSGASALRAAYQQLLEDARRGQFDIVVAEALDRLSRDQEDIAGLFKRLNFAGVRLVTLAEGEISELHVGLKGTMNALFLKDLADKTRRGLEGRVRQGRSGGGLSYGYVVVRECDANGDPVYGGRKINQAEAEIVHRIFAEFAAGKSPRRIAVALNREQIAGPRRGEWDASTINGNAARGPVFSTTSFTSGAWSGIGCATSRIRARESVFRGSMSPTAGSCNRFRSCRSSRSTSGMRSRPARRRSSGTRGRISPKNRTGRNSARVF